VGVDVLARLSRTLKYDKGGRRRARTMWTDLVSQRVGEPLISSVKEGARSTAGIPNGRQLSRPSTVVCGGGKEGRREPDYKEKSRPSQGPSPRPSAVSASHSLFRGWHGPGGFRIQASDRSANGDGGTLSTGPGTSS
jgi:hypothetical protein